MFRLDFLGFSKSVSRSRLLPCRVDSDQLETNTNYMLTLL